MNLCINYLIILNRNRFIEIILSFFYRIMLCLCQSFCITCCLFVFELRIRFIREIMGFVGVNHESLNGLEVDGRIMWLGWWRWMFVRELLSFCTDWWFTIMNLSRRFCLFIDGRF